MSLSTVPYSLKTPHHLENSGLFVKKGFTKRKDIFFYPMGGFCYLKILSELQEMWHLNLTWEDDNRGTWRSLLKYSFISIVACCM